MTKLQKKDELRVNILDIIDDLPFPFSAISEFPYTDEEKKVAFFSFLNASSVTLPNLFFEFRENKFFTPFFQLVYGKSASGKGRLSIASKALYKIRKKIEILGKNPRVKLIPKQYQNNTNLIPQWY